MGLFNRKRKAIDFFDTAYKDALKLLNASTFKGSPIIRDDLIPILFVVTDVANFHAGKDRYEFGSAFANWIDRKGRQGNLDQRIDFYGQFLRGKQAKMEFWLGDPIENRDPLMELAGAFCDILNSPHLQDDYDSKYLNIGSIFDSVSIVPQVFLPLYKLLGNLYSEVNNS